MSINLLLAQMGFTDFLEFYGEPHEKNPCMKEKKG